MNKLQEAGKKHKMDITVKSQLKSPEANALFSFLIDIFPPK